MSIDRRGWIRTLLAADHDRVSTLARICTLAVSEPTVTGAGVVLIDHAGTIDAQQRLVRASDDVATRLEDLQLTVGEGPGLTAAAAGGPVLVPDLAVETSRWPAFTPGARAAGAAAMFVYRAKNSTYDHGQRIWASRRRGLARADAPPGSTVGSRLGADMCVERS